MSLGPFDLTGGPFLQLYGALLVLTIIAGLIIPRWLRPEGRMPRNTDMDHLAFLAGGASRFAETVTARLLSTKQLVMDGKKFLAGGFGAATPAERSVLALPQPADWSAVAGAAGRHVDPIRERLIADGLLMDGWTALQLRFWQTSPYLLLLAFGWTKLQIGEARGKPTGYLTLLLVITAVFALIRFAALDRRTRAGNEMLSEARERSDRLRRAPASGEAGLAVALFGTTVLVGSEWGDFHRMRASDGGGSGGDGGSSSGGGDGGGCGGGGCGGCGGG
ncbi:TIGR04222 domain-containing membrane protein [Sphingomonas sp. DG1-23]|uniref:TIGR04222 domain-containing membrane protein n=1 Tax=Sphingomonas sp. DG1-23 TaxID=3068316 RepID=UPI00273E6FB1|nr:TIGR04222 domain-containing membrane protein [Sphingomonas sp. DG1-23]MDP5278033.1 TIGR04222 domain-containing membrane protein [Sphingomonas sp. DG1-23]